MSQSLGRLLWRRSDKETVDLGEITSIKIEGLVEEREVSRAIGGYHYGNTERVSTLTGSVSATVKP